jgi:hypothetical protein
VRYRITSAAEGRTVLTLAAPERASLVTLLVLIGLFCLLTGLAYALPDGGKADPLRALFFIGFGLFCFCAMFFAVAGIPFPKRLVFDDPTGWLYAEISRGKPERAVPYGGIAGFSLREARRDTMNLHSAGIDIRMGGRWELYAARRPDAPKRFLDALSSSVHLGSPTLGDPPAPLEMKETRFADGKRRFEWSRRARALPLAASLVTLISFSAAFAGIRPLASGAGAYLIAFSFLVVLLSATAVGAIRAAGERVRVEVDPGSVSWRRRSLFAREKGFTVPTSDIRAADLSSSFARMESAVSLLRAEDLERFNSYRQGTLPPLEAMRIPAFLRSLRRIDVSALGLGDRVLLAEAIRSLLRE